MKRISAAVFVLSFVSAVAQGDRTYTLQHARLTYHMSHPVHELDGTSEAARGRAVCHAGMCDLLVAAPVKSFTSGDTNRDLHMLQVTRGGQFPVVSVRVHVSQDRLDSPSFDCDLDVEFAGNTAHYTHLVFQQTITGEQHHVTGKVPATLSDFKIDPPTFLMMPIKNEIPITVDATWVLAKP